MRVVVSLFGALALASCNGPLDAPVTETLIVSGANGAMWGTDAQLAPSKPDAVLRYADHPRGFAELRLPEGKGPFPLAVMFHGGCFKYGIADQAYMSPLATQWQKAGIATLNVDYREVGDGGGWPGSFVDWAAAAKLIDRVAATYPVDRETVTLVGHSAGATAALWLASASGAEGPVGARPATKARGVLVLDGAGDLGREAADFDALCQFSSVAPFLGGHPSAPIAPAPEVKDVVFVQAKLPAPPAASIAALASKGAKVRVIDNRGDSHFSIITPGDPVQQRNEPAMLRLLHGE